MSLVGFKAQNHQQQLLERGPLQHVDDRATPSELFDPLHQRHDFTVDVAAAEHNAKCARFYNIDQNGLLQTWESERVWCNPPYSEIRPWVEKAWATPTALVVMLVPANRTEQAWWQDLIEPFRDRGGRLRCEFLRGRYRFVAAGAAKASANERPPFGCVLLTWMPTGNITDPLVTPSAQPSLLGGVS